MKPFIYFVNPPVPSRAYDYCAFFDPETGPYGFGETKEAAISDLHNQIDE